MADKAGCHFLRNCKLQYILRHSSVCILIILCLGLVTLVNGLHRRYGAVRCGAIPYPTDLLVCVCLLDGDNRDIIMIVCHYDSCEKAGRARRLNLVSINPLEAL